MNDELIKFHEPKLYPYHAGVPGYSLGLFTKLVIEDIAGFDEVIYLNE